MNLEYIIIIASSVLALVLYYLLLHKKAVQSVEDGIQEIHNSFVLLHNDITIKHESLSELTSELQKVDLLFEAQLETIFKDIEKIKQSKIKELEKEFHVKEKDMEGNISAMVQMHNNQVRNNIIETAYLVAIEYFKSRQNYSSEEKKKITHRLSKDIQIN